MKNGASSTVPQKFDFVNSSVFLDLRWGEVYASCMHPLFPYEQNTAKVSLLGKVERRDEHTLMLTYDIVNPRGIVKNAPHGEEQRITGNRLIRAHELWKDTCFELFFSEPGSGEYFECNVNVKGKWNVYAFTAYRNPMPPQEVPVFRVTSVRVGEGILAAEIVGELPLPRTLECGLSAVINTTQGEFFYATSHKSTKPDFHMRESFVVRV